MITCYHQNREQYYKPNFNFNLCAFNPFLACNSGIPQVGVRVAVCQSFDRCQHHWLLGNLSKLGPFSFFFSNIPDEFFGLNLWCQFAKYAERATCNIEKISITERGFCQYCWQLEAKKQILGTQRRRRGRTAQWNVTLGHLGGLLWVYYPLIRRKHNRGEL